MNYENGLIVLADTKKGFVPNAIKWLTGSQFSHSLVIAPPILGIPMCIEAAEGGVDIVKFDKNYVDNKNEGYQVWRIKISQTTKDRALKKIFNDLECSYGFSEFGWFIWRSICRWFGKDIKNQNNWVTSQSSYICSQLVVAYLKACGLKRVLKGYGINAIAPQDLQDIFMSVLIYLNWWNR